MFSISFLMTAAGRFFIKHWAEIAFTIMVGLALGAMAWWSYSYIWRKGYDRAYSLYTASEQRRVAENAAALELVRDIEAKANARIASAATVYVEKIKTVYVKQAAITKEIPKYVPIDSPLLPAGWVLVHDAAAQQTDIAPLERASGVTSAERNPQAALQAVADNYAVCHREIARVAALQTIVKACIANEATR